MNLFLIGFRCTGKTTVGEALAQRLDWTFVDTDRRVVETAGVSITQMVDAHGWPFFREQERKALRAVSAGNHQVVATGGGIVLDECNITAMKTSGKVVWLTASEKTIQARMLDDEATAGSRPSLTGEELTAEVSSVLSARTPLYEKAADYQTATDRHSVTAVCDRITAALSLASEVGTRMTTVDGKGSSSRC
jgi:shikimate kinase